jgi:CelD/BcsL family acetyltransferase involved in cellulose biosynthesis
MPALLDRGALELRWLEARGEPIAAIYNIAWQGKVQFYQGGRRMDLPKGLRPGTAIQALAIRAAIEDGRREYDFLAGTARYKMELALAARPLVELRATRPSLGDAARRAAELAIAQARALRRSLWSHHRPGS